uniref:uncharacterized protein LOC122605636 n=1 Tax=Erigeron canadensis TaxID=72917 RepID=UPI001CB8CC74|nr:uncharacterized protein LOC122605636 [Erigeron canadensis]
METLNQQDWEVVNEDGFIFRRPKRLNLDLTNASAAAPPPDPAAEAKARVERKKRALLKLKSKYGQEIRHWELLSNTLQALENRTSNQPIPTSPPAQDQTVAVPPESSSDSASRELADTLLAQVSAQEATIIEISRLCDGVEALCEDEEQRLKQRFMDLPIWDPSPQELMTALVEE